MSLLRNGLGELHVVSSGEPIAAELAGVAAELAAEVGGTAVHGVLRNPADLTDADVAAYDVVLLTAGFGGDLPVGQLLRLVSRPRPGGPVLLPGFAIGRLAIMGPQVTSGASPCWACALLRLDRNLDPGTMSALWRTASLPGLAAAVYPFSALNAPGVFERSAAGAGAGLTTAQARRAGLLSAIGYLALRATMSGDSPARRLAPGAWGGDREAGFLLDAANTLGHSVAVFELRVPDAEGAAAIVAVVLAAADLDGTGPDGARRPAWGLGTGNSVRDAAVSAVRDLVGHLQLASPEGGAEGTDMGPELLRDFDPRTILSSVAPGGEQDSVLAGEPGDPVAATDEIARSLLGAGYEALCVDTTPPDLRSTGLFATSRVLLRRTGR